MSASVSSCEMLASPSAPLACSTRDSRLREPSSELKTGALFRRLLLDAKSSTSARDDFALRVRFFFEDSDKLCLNRWAFESGGFLLPGSLESLSCDEPTSCKSRSVFTLVNFFPTTFPCRFLRGVFLDLPLLEIESVESQTTPPFNWSSSSVLFICARNTLNAERRLVEFISQTATNSQHKSKLFPYQSARSKFNILARLPMCIGTRRLSCACNVTAVTLSAGGRGGSWRQMGDCRQSRKLAM